MTRILSMGIMLLVILCCLCLMAIVLTADDETVALLTRWAVRLWLGNSVLVGGLVMIVGVNEEHS